MPVEDTDLTEDTDLEFLHCVLVDELWVGAAFWEKGEVSVTVLSTGRGGLVSATQCGGWSLV
jgi:hypothetical protein